MHMNQRRQPGQRPQERRGTPEKKTDGVRKGKRGALWDCYDAGEDSFKMKSQTK